MGKPLDQRLDEIIGGADSVTIYKDLLQRLWRGYDPYAGFPYRTVKPDLQGWQSKHRYLADSVARLRPAIILEVGVWKGGSCLELARAVQVNGLDVAVIAVDTWLGSAEHWQIDHWHEALGFEFGYPTLFRTFLANMVLGGVREIVVPLPLDSANACEVIRHFDIRPDLIHIDGAHDLEAARGDLARWWAQLRPGGTLIVDDYDKDGNCWPGTFAAVNEFIAQNRVLAFESETLKCRFLKPAEG